MFRMDFRFLNIDDPTINLSNVVLRCECHLHVFSLDVYVQPTLYLYAIVAK